MVVKHLVKTAMLELIQILELGLVIRARMDILHQGVVIPTVKHALLELIIHIMEDIIVMTVLLVPLLIPKLQLHAYLILSVERV
tara:strand:- start:268 stop:519 length:252 start_codon:yes stop_codon:yes gene_type:complete